MHLVRQRSLLMIAGMLMCVAVGRQAHAYVDLAPTIGKVVSDARNIAVIEFQEFDRGQKKLTVKEIKTLKGQKGAVPLVQMVANSEKSIVPRGILQWAEPGAHAVVFHSGRTALVCVGQSWYQFRQAGSGQWRLDADRPELPLTYYGSVNRLAEGLEKMLAGGEAILTTLPHAVDENASFELALNRFSYPGLVRVERFRANLKMPGTVWGVAMDPDFFIGLGPVDVSDLPALIGQLEKGNSEIVANVAEDIRQLTEIVGAAKTRVAVPALEKCLTDALPRARFNAAGAILRITHGHEAAAKVLAAGLAHADAKARRDAANAASITTTAGAPLVATLQKLLKDEEAAVRFAALQALATLGPVAAAARDAVVPLLDSPDDMIDAADALGRMGIRARPVPPQMVKMLQSDQILVRQAALRGMSQIGGDEALPAAEYIAREIGTANEIEGYNMVEYLALLGPVAKGPAAKIKSVPLPNFIVTDAANWAMNAPHVPPWSNGPLRTIGPLGELVYEAFVVELGERLAPCAKVLAPQLMAGKAGDVPEWGYLILNADPAGSIAVIAPYLKDKEKVMRERAALFLGRMGPPAVAARAQLEAAIATATDEREANLMKWALGEITKD